MNLFNPEYIEEPQNAYIDITAENYTVVDEVEGISPIKEKVSEEIVDAVNNQLDSIKLSDNCYEKP